MAYWPNEGRKEEAKGATYHSDEHEIVVCLEALEPNSANARICSKGDDAQPEAEQSECFRGEVGHVVLGCVVASMGKNRKEKSCGTSYPKRICSGRLGMGRPSIMTCCILLPVNVEYLRHGVYLSER